MKEAFDILTDSMQKKGDEQLLSHGKFSQTFDEGANALKKAPDLQSTEYNMKLAEEVEKKLADITVNDTPEKLNRAMKDMVDICSKYLSQNAEYNKMKGPAFKILVNALRGDPHDKLYGKGKIQRTNAQAANELEQAKGLETDHDDPNLSQEIHSAMTKLVKASTPDELKNEMAETVNCSSKYLSQKAVDDAERGPGFDLLVKQLKREGGEPFSDFPALSTKYAAAYTLSSAPGLGSVAPDPKTVPEFTKALHKVVDPVTPQKMKQEVKDVVDSSANYLSGFIRDRGPAMNALMDMMKNKPKTVFSKQNDYTMNYEDAVNEAKNAPTLVPYLPVKDIADEGKHQLTKDMKQTTPSNLKIPMQTLIQDVSKHLSQAVAMRSGAAGDKYSMNLLAAVKDSLGSKPLYKYKDYGQTYSDAAETLKNTSPLDDTVSKMNLQSRSPEIGKSTINLGHEIASEMNRGIPEQLAPTIAEELQPTMNKAAKHLAVIGSDKGKALEHIVDLMKEKGATPLAELQGYEQTHGDGARRIEDSSTLTNEKVDKKAYESVKTKLTEMVTDNPNEKLAANLPGMIEESAKFLSAPVPETPAEKRTVLGDLMGRQENEILGEGGIYKMTYKEAAQEVKKAPVGIIKSHDEKKEKEMEKKLEAIIPDQKMAALLKEPTKEGAAHLTDVIAGRGEALEIIQESLKKEKDKEFIEVGDFKKTHEQVAKMITDAPNFTTAKPSPVILQKVEHEVSAVTKDIPPDKKMAKEHMDETSKIAAKYIAGVATNESGLNPQELTALDEAGFNAGPKAAAEARRLAALEGAAGGTYGPDGKFIPGAAGGTYGPDGKFIPASAGDNYGPDGKLVTDAAGGTYGPDGKLIPGAAGGTYGPDGKLITGAEGGTYGPDGKFIPGAAGGTYGPDGKLITGAEGGTYGPDGKFIPGAAGGTYGPDGKLISGAAGGTYGPDGKFIPGAAGGTYGPDGKLIPGAAGGTYGPDGKFIPGAAGGTYGPDGKFIPAAAGSIYGPDGVDGPIFGETEEQRRRRLAEAETYRKYEEEERRRLGDKEYFRRQAEKRQLLGRKYDGGALGADYDPEHASALNILHRELRAYGSKVFYEQPQTALTYVQASDWLATPTPMRVDKSVRDSGDTARLNNKFERKLTALVSNVTPPKLYDCMQDVVIESSRRLSEFFVATNYKAHVTSALISEMQKRGNEIFAELDGAAETMFFTAQRLKKSKTFTVTEPCYRVAHELANKMEDVMRNRPQPRKLASTMKEHIKEAADYLSTLVTKPDTQIEAYIALLDEMEAAGDSKLVDGNIPKSHKEATDYLRQLTTFEDLIKRPNRSLQSGIESKLRNLMAHVEPTGYTDKIMDTVIAESTGLLVSYIMLQGEKTEALKVLLGEIEQAGDSMLLRHGPIRKSFKDGARLLEGKTTDQLYVPNADPVVSRKIEIRLNNLMLDKIPEKYERVMGDVIEQATMYLAVQLLQPQLIKVCKCMKNVFVQCELWNDEILRRVERPCCTCSRHVSAQLLQDLAPAQRLRITPGLSGAFAPGLAISITSCPYKKPSPTKPCPASNSMSPECQKSPTTSYLMYSTAYDRFSLGDTYLHPSPSASDSVYSSQSSLSSPVQQPKSATPIKTPEQDNIQSDSVPFLEDQQETIHSFEAEMPTPLEEDRRYSFHTTDNDLAVTAHTSNEPYEHDPKPMFSKAPSTETDRITQAKSGYSSRTPIIMEQMDNWHAMMVSLMWNVQAWRDWIQEIVDRALAFQRNPNVTRVSDQTADNWTSFRRRVSTEALQWRHYSIFSREHTRRLILRYKDKEMVAPKQYTAKTKMYIACLEEILDIIDMFNRWTQWLALVVKETDLLQDNTASDIPLHEMRWSYLKKKADDYSNDWFKYNRYLKVSWEQKYNAMISEYLPSCKEPGPVWVVSASGAVPSGAVAAGVVNGEVTWVARTTHRDSVLPAALYPSKHCCLVYVEGVVHHYTRYEVMCNTEVRWVAWRGGSVGGGAVRAARGVHVGRVHYRGDHLLGAVLAPHYRCHVVIFGRPFAFNCYELLVLADHHD